MKRTMLHVFSMLAFLLLSTSNYAQSCPGASRDVSNSKSGTPNDAIGVAMKGFFADGGSSTWRFEPGAKFVENTDGTAKLTGVLAYYDKPTRRLQVDINLVGQTYNAPAGSPVLFNTTPSINGWYYYFSSASTLTGIGDLAGAKVDFLLRGKAAQVGIGGADAAADAGKLGMSAWFVWSVVSQPSNAGIRINPFPATPAIDQADISITLSGNPTVCGDPCATDTQKPVFTSCAGSQTLSTAGTCANASWTLPAATDNCSTPTLSFVTSPTAGLTNGACYPVGTTVVTYTATDAKGNTSTCSFSIVVNKVVNPCDNDTDKPVFTGCPADQILQATTGQTCVNATWTAPIATDNCGTPTVVSASSSSTVTKSGDCFPIGKTTITYTATDAKGNKAICTFFIMVNPAPDPCLTDAIKPVITGCPANQTLTAATGATCANASWTAPNATDNCTLASFTFATSPTAGLTNGGCYPIGTTTVTYTATDAKGNTAVCSFTITVNAPVNPCTTDAIKPVITGCPANQTLTAATGATCANASWTAPNATDNCTLASFTFATSPTAGLTNGGCYPVGTTTVTYTATDAKGNTTTCSFTITVNAGAELCLTDNIKPVISGCPTNQTLSAATGATCVNASWTAPTAADNCTLSSFSFATSPNAGLTNGGCYPLGTTTVTYTATDAKNNTSICSFTITVNAPVDVCATDVTKPVISGCPANITGTSGGINNNCSTINAWIAPTATDNCNLKTLTFATSPTANIPNGGCFPIGVTTVTYTATDAKGNTATCSFTVTIVSTCSQITDPGSITGSETFCPGSPLSAILESSPANGGTGTIEYMWMYSTTSSTFDNGAGWESVPNSNTKNLTTIPTLTGTTYFIRCVRRLGCDNFKESNVVVKTAKAVAQIDGPYEACLGADVTFEGLDSGAGSTYAWYIDNATISSSTNRIVKFKFTSIGSKRVRYEVYNGGCIQKITRFVDVKSCLLGSGGIDNFNLVVSNGKAVQLDWKTSNEKLSSMYVVESSADGVNFAKVAEVPAQIKAVGIYRFMDEKPKMGRSFYRIMHIENDGNITYTAKKQSVLYINGGDKAMAYPNPTNGQIFVEVLDVDNNEGIIEVYNELGKLVKTQNFAKSQVRYEINTSELATGIYILKIRSANNDVKTIKFIKQ
jgi:HYR domain/Secretion system C-terminal sorting domain